MTTSTVAATAEEAAQRRLTEAFIATSPLTLVLTPRAREKTPAGGWTFVAGEPRAAQVMKLIENGGGMLPSPVATLDGIERRVEFQLLGRWGASVANYDTFDLDGRIWEVVQVAHPNGWSVRALVARSG